MARIEIPLELRDKLGPEMKMDVHWIDVRLANGDVLYNLVVRGGSFITGRALDENGVGSLEFSADHIAVIRRHKPRFWPLW